MKLSLAFLAAAALLVGCGHAPQPVAAPSAVPTFAGYLGMVFEETSDGALVGVNFVDHPYTENEFQCEANIDAYVAGADKPTGHDVIKHFCLQLVRPVAGRLTQIAVINHGFGQQFVAVAVEFEDGKNPVWGADVLGQSKDEASCIATGRATIHASLKDGKVKHPLTISCIAVPPPAADSKPENESTV